MQTFIRYFFRDFFLITTGTLFATAIFTTIFLGIDYRIPIFVFWQVFAFSLAITLPNFVFVSKNELSKKEMAIRKVIHFFLLLIIGSTLARYFEWIDFTHTRSFLTFLVLVCFIYALVTLITNYREKKLALNLNQKLKIYQEHKK